MVHFSLSVQFRKVKGEKLINHNHIYEPIFKEISRSRNMRLLFAISNLITLKIHSPDFIGWSFMKVVKSSVRENFIAFPCTEDKSGNYTCCFTTAILDFR